MEGESILTPPQRCSDVDVVRLSDLPSTWRRDTCFRPIAELALPALSGLRLVSAFRACWEHSAVPIETNTSFDLFLEDFDNDPVALPEGSVCVRKTSHEMPFSRTALLADGLIRSLGQVFQHMRALETGAYPLLAGETLVSFVAWRGHRSRRISTTLRKGIWYVDADDRALMYTAPISARTHLVAC